MTVESQKEYKPTLEDKLDWDLLSQLHKVVLQISSFCFRTKQIFLTVDIAVIGILVKISENKLNDAMFIAGFIIPIVFWSLDSIAYFYQVKIRGIMESIRERILARNTEKIITLSPIIEESRVSESNFKKIIHSFFNHSMWIYLILFASDLALWYLVAKGII